MRKISSTVLPWGMSLLAVACTKATFSGSGLGSRIERRTPALNPEDVSCTFSSPEVKVGEKAELAISSKSDPGEVMQVTFLGDEKVEVPLVWKEGRLLLKDGSASSLVAERPGTYRVEIALAADGQSERVLTTCELKVVENSNPNPDLSPSPSPVPPPQPSPNPSVPDCRPDQVKIGTEMVFLIDNSNSNAATDCPSPRQIDTFAGTELYECGQETNRERAVLSVFDLLKEFGRGTPSDALAQSRVAVTSFPTKEDFVGGFKVESSFVSTADTTRAQLQTALSFTRKPFGLTPYVAAMNGADTVMRGIQSDKRSKVVVLVTDGEPTDRGPKSAAQKAESLRQSGMKVISVFYSGGATKGQRRASHVAMMQRFEDEFRTRPEGHWYDVGQFSSFETYVNYLLGDQSNPSVLERITSRRDPACQDSSVQVCPRLSYEVGSAEGLQTVFREIVTSQAIGCGS